MPVLVLGDPEDVNTFLSDPNALQKPYIYKFFKNERGLVTSPRKANEINNNMKYLINPLSSYLEGPPEDPEPFFQLQCDETFDSLVQRQGGQNDGGHRGKGY